MKRINEKHLVRYLSSSWGHQDEFKIFRQLLPPASTHLVIANEVSVDFGSGARYHQFEKSTTTARNTCIVDHRLNSDNFWRIQLCLSAPFAVS
jgi:hypothetical protein